MLGHALAAIIAVMATRAKLPAKLPNLVMILPDDLGYFGAVSCVLRTRLRTTTLASYQLKWQPRCFHLCADNHQGISDGNLRCRRENRGGGVA